MRLFIAGTDTGVGKTYASCNLLNFFNQQGLSTLAIKPISSGSLMTIDGLRNEDALALQQHASIKLAYEEVNPFTFLPPIAPHIGAEQQGIKLTLPHILEKCAPALNHTADLHLIEGTGGWLVPLNDKETFADLALALNAEIILVVGIRLGCINHTLLSIEAIKNKGCKLKGWIANCIDQDMLHLEENITSLKARIHEPLIGIIPYGGQAKHFTI